MESEEGGGRGEAWGIMGEVGTEGDHRPAVEGSIFIRPSHNGCSIYGKYIVCINTTKYCVCCNLP